MIITLGILSGLGLLLLFAKLGIRKILTFEIPIDIAITGLLIWAFAGTFSGMVAGLMGGLAVSIVLFIMRRTMDREVPYVERKGYKITSGWKRVGPGE